jgi:uncharacterized cupredoxin-like copper-binding protein
MNLKVRFWLLSLALVGTAILSACGGSTGGGTTPAGGGSGAAALAVTAQDTLKFDPAALTAKANTATTVNVKNAGALQHNWVVVKPEDADKVDQAAAAKTGDATGIAGVLSGGTLINAGASESVTVNLPAGTYTYLCTFPGHYQAGMKGTLTVN